ncbi:hypothetical protein ACHAW5_001610 [Stephanodiscus triporus]|uniref:Uncharacterized protein n=1 Tax=Stephanodiscus triporus TaxID=2934178 RepID=A0ABD3PZE2_9STRA
MVEYHPLRSEDHNPTTAEYARLNNDAERRAKECRSAKMPCLSHLCRRDYDDVYEPSDDTYLLIDAIGMDVDAMMTTEGEEGERRRRRDDRRGGEKRGGDIIEKKIIRRDDIEITLEIGCGTGVPTVYLATRLRDMAADDRRVVARGEDDATEDDANDDDDVVAAKKKTSNSRRVAHFVTDINADAIRITKSTATMNGLSHDDVRAIGCDLASELLDELENDVDVLIFNPPYVPTPDEDVGSTAGIEASWAGGADGRVVIDRALPQIARLLAYPHGVAYVVVVDDNYPERIMQLMYERYGILVIPWLRRRARNEYLTILKMTTTRMYSGQTRERDFALT